MSTDLAEAWGALEAAVASEAEAVVLDEPVEHYRHYRPFVDAVRDFTREARQTKRIYTGIEEFDAEMRGVGPGHLCVIVGYSHSGKTLLLTDILRRNREKRIAFFSPDEPATLTLTKLASLSTGIPARDLEERVSSGDEEAVGILEYIAEEEYPNLAVFAKQLTPDVLQRGYDEACHVWDAEADLVVIDFLDLVQAGEIATAKFDFVKGWGIEHNVPIILIHQTSRSAGSGGQAMTISSGNYGGEQHATFMLGVRRKKAALLDAIRELEKKLDRKFDADDAQRLSELQHDLAIHEYTLTVNLVKNKRPGGRLVDEMDFELEIDTGRIRPLHGDLPAQYRNRLRTHRPTPEPPRPCPSWEERQLDYVDPWGDT